MKIGIYFLIKEEKVFIEYMEILEKVSNIIKNKFNSDLIYSKKYLKAEKKIENEVFNVYMHQQYLLIKFIEKMKTIILKCF